MSYYSRLLACMLFCFILHGNARAGILVTHTYTLASDQWPALKTKARPYSVYILFSGSLSEISNLPQRNDTIFQLRQFMDFIAKKSAGNRTQSFWFRFVFGSADRLDSLRETDLRMRLKLQAFPDTEAGTNTETHLLVATYDTLGTQLTNTRIAIHDAQNTPVRNLRLRPEHFGARGFFRIPAANALLFDNLKGVSGRQVWMLSIGINRYANVSYNNCVSDASSYVESFRNGFRRHYREPDSAFHSFLLTDSNATRANIMQALQTIIGHADEKDFFVFNFSGMSYRFSFDSTGSHNYFFPFDVPNVNKIGKRKEDSTALAASLISLNSLLRLFQLIPARNQLFLTESGPTDDFKTELLQTLLETSETANILNKNRVLLLPNETGMDSYRCGDVYMDKGPLNYYITSLDSSANIYKLFGTEKEQDAISYQLKAKQYQCAAFPREYFDVFFEKRFLNQFARLTGNSNSELRGIERKESLRKAAALDGGRYALVIGTDHYQAAGWKKLSNAAYDARDVADLLQKEYGFTPQLLIDAPADSIYRALVGYYTKLQPNDQLLIYFAGHGDIDPDMMGDAFIVCSDSRSVADDPVRNTYLQYARLKRMINRIAARQILVVLDVCYGGAMDDAVLEGTRDNSAPVTTNRNMLQFLQDKSKYKTRYFLTSVGATAAFDGKAGKHSPFANLFLQILRGRGAQTHGVITLSDIYAVLQNQSLNESENLRIAPHKAGFGSNEPLSEFILIPVEKTGN